MTDAEGVQTLSDPYLEVRGLTKSYGSTRAIDNVDLSIDAGSVLVLLGPSGCGKTTILRIIAGILAADSGEVRIGGENLLGVPIHERDIGMVFQTWALFPHMTVEENVGFGLKMRGIGASERSRRIAEALDLVMLGPLARRRPSELSGGQQQRVALARAIVTEPRLLLLDEPLSSLDLKIRSELRRQVREIQRSLGITAVYVTHDHSEAMALGDQVAVMSVGKVVETGPPETVFTRPRTEYVSEFLGFDNILRGQAVQAGRNVEFELAGGGTVPVQRPDHEGEFSRFSSIALSPWDIHLTREMSSSALKGEVISVEYQMGRAFVTTAVAELDAVISSYADPVGKFRVGEVVAVRPDWSRATLLEGVPKDEGEQ